MKKEFVVNRQGKDFVLYAGLLDQAFREGLKRISTSVVQAPSDANGNLAIVHCEVETEKGVFSGIGDASPQNVGRMIAPHLTRMAETRAKARALRDAINVGTTALEELADFEEQNIPPSTREPARAPDSNVRPIRPPAQARPQAPAVQQQQPAAEGLATEEQYRRYAKLAASLGEAVHPWDVFAALSQADAAETIAEKVKLFNAKAREGRRS